MRLIEASKLHVDGPVGMNLGRMTSDSGDMSQITVTRRRTKVRRLRYTCRTKKTPSSEEEDVGDSVKVSLSVSSSEKEEVVLSYGSVSVIGRRKEMEDAVRAELGVMNKKGDGGGGGVVGGKYDFFGVYDGHGGCHVARACSERLHGILVEEGESSNEELEGLSEYNWERVMKACFAKMDEEVVGVGGGGVGRTVGSTAVVAVVGEEELVVANCGDCRAVLFSGGVALALSRDHKPDRPDELKRIEAAGGKVINWNGNRVLGVLTTSRSIGDHYLRPYVISKPEVTVTKRSNNDEFLILASDGLWDVISNEVACQIVKRCLEGRLRRKSLEVEVENESRAAEAAAVLTELAMARGSKDNISVIVVELRKPRGFSSL
ncbi:protein phosphatase 2C 51-like [Quercus robur]|uniref:protein phosphatase 2C 51-like n=1 Tax=Quercus robur TaxID=38942 RepID=UPI0021612AE4|nr:protein phosphatase 2C 51-like [Quercus robur]